MRQVNLSPLNATKPTDPFGMWVVDSLKLVENASQIDVISNVHASGAALSTLNNAAANQVPMWTSATQVTFLQLSSFFVTTLAGLNSGASWLAALGGAPAGSYLIASNNLSDLANASTARTNLGIVANPSATIGLAAVNGSANTAIRSDGAPALSQAIAPTWSAQHIFNGGATFGGSSWVYFTGNVGILNPVHTQGLSVAWNQSNGGGEVNLVANNDGGAGVYDFIFQDWNGSTLSNLVYVLKPGGIYVPGPSAFLQCDLYLGTPGTVGGTVAASTADLWAVDALVCSDGTARTVPYDVNGNITGNALQTSLFLGNSSAGTQDPSPQGSNVGLAIANVKANVASTIVYGQTGGIWFNIRGGYTGATSFTASGTTVNTSKAITGVGATTPAGYRIVPGMPVTGAGIQLNTVVTSVVGSTVNISLAATAGATVTLTFTVNFSGTAGDTFGMSGDISTFDLSSFCVLAEHTVNVFTAGVLTHGLRVQFGVATGQTLAISVPGGTHLIGCNLIMESAGGAEGVAYYASPGPHDWGLFAAASGFKMTVAGAISAPSDPSMKREIKRMPDVREIIRDIHPITYKWRNENFYDPTCKGKTLWGFASLDHEDIGGVKNTFDRHGHEFGAISAMNKVRRNDSLSSKHKYENTNETFYGLDHNSMIAIAWKGLQEALDEIDALKVEIQELKKDK